MGQACSTGRPVIAAPEGTRDWLPLGVAGLAALPYLTGTHAVLTARRARLKRARADEGEAGRNRRRKNTNPEGREGALTTVTSRSRRGGAHANCLRVSRPARRAATGVRCPTRLASRMDERMTLAAGDPSTLPSASETLAFANRRL